VTVRDPCSTWTNSGHLYVGYEGTGTLSIAGGGAVSNPYASIGCSGASYGVVTVDGAGSTWTNSGSLYVGGSAMGDGGTGSLKVGTGGVVNVGETLVIWTKGTVELNGGTISLGDLAFMGSEFHFHAGTLNFTGDKTFQDGDLDHLLGEAHSLRVGRHLSVEGTATLQTDLYLDGGALSVGDLVSPTLLEFGRGTLNLTDADLTIGPGGLFGPALRLERDQHVNVTNDAGVASGGLLSGNGGRLSAGALAVLSGGEVCVGPGERLTIAGPAVNDGGQMTLGGGTLHFQDALTNTGGGLVMGNGMLRADGGTTNEATMAFSGLANLIGDVNNTADGLIWVTGGGPTTFFDDVHNDGNVHVTPGSMAVYFGGVSGDGNFPGGGTSYFDGDLKPGSSAGIMSFEGSVAFGSLASLEIELGDNDNSDPENLCFDALDVAGDVSLAGALSVEWLPIDGDANSKFGGVYDILSYGGSRTGVFDGIDCQMAAYLDTSVFDDGIEYDDANGAVKVHLYDLLDGDADLDGRVAREDFAALQVGFGSPEADWFTGDFNLDGRVDFLDYLTWKANVGDAVPGAGNAPEPATLLLLALGGLAVMKRRRS